MDKIGPLIFKEMKNLKKLNIAEVDAKILDLLPSLERLTLDVGDSSSIKGKHKNLSELIIENSRGEFKNIEKFPNLKIFSISGSRLNKMTKPLTLKKTNASKDWRPIRS